MSTKGEHSNEFRLRALEVAAHGMPTNMAERVLGAEALLSLVTRLAIELRREERELLEFIGRLGPPNGWRNPEEVVLAVRWACGHVDADTLVRRTAGLPTIAAGRPCVN